MRNSKISISVIFLLTFMFAKSQTYFSPNQIFDTLRDNYGNKYSLKDLKIDTVGVDGSGNNTKTFVCNSGYFKLYFEPGCGMYQNTPQENARRSVICDLFSHISAFIPSPLTASGKKVNIWIRNTTNFGLPAGVNAAAKTFYSGIGTGAIVDNEIWKTINSGQDSYAGIVSPIASTGAFYHGMMAFDFSYNWHADLLTAAPTGTFDLYTIALHEITHALGFSSLISFNGNSYIPWGYNRYDKNLKTQTNLPLITNSGSCSMYNYVINPSISNITYTLSPGGAACGTLPSTAYTNSTTCSQAILYASNTQTIPVYTPNCFEPPSSLHHFEDMCYPTPNPANNDQYFVMCSGIPAGVTRRYLKEEERKVLCDIGYSVNATYGSPTYTTTQKTYTTGVCNGLGVAGVNDGLSAGLYTIFTTTGVATSAITPLANDVPNSGLSFECLQVVVGTGALSTTSGTAFTYTPLVSGVHVLKYIPYNTSTLERGNITYIYVFVSAMAGCTPSSICELITNKGFENMTTNCGPFSIWTPPLINCWDLISGYENVYTRNCANTSYTVPNLNFNTTPFDSWNNAPNNAFIALTNNLNTLHNGLIQTQLSSGLVNGNQYQLSFWASPISNTIYPIALHANIDFAMSVAPVIAPIPIATITPIPFNSIGQFNLIQDKLWHYYKTVFTFTGTTGSKNFGILDAAEYLTPNTFPFLLDDISILPVASVSTFSLQPQICIGTNINNLQTLVSIPSGTFTGPGVTGSSGSYTFNSTTAGSGWQTIVYTYTTSSGCTLTEPAQIYVIGAAPTVTISTYPYLNHPYCPGETFTLTVNTSIAPNLSTYTWSPGSYTTQIAIVNPSVSTVYTVSVGNSLGCNAPVTSTVQILIDTPIPVITPSVQYICVGQTATLSTTYTNSAQSYTWMPGASNNLTITVSPTVSTVYTLTASGFGSCYGTGTSTVYMQCCSTNTIACALTNTVINSGSYSMNLNTTIAGTVSLYSVELSIAPSISITILPNSTLTINKSHLYACNEMWQGITVQPGGYLNIESDALIEDAITAVSIPSPTNTVGPILRVNTSVFNKNYIAVSITNYTPSITSYPFEIKNTIFTSRQFTTSGMSWPQVAPLKTTCTVTNNLASPYCLQNFPLSNLKAPYTTQSAYIGLNVNYVGRTINPGGTPTYYSLTVGDYTTISNFNIFDNLYYGIAATDANLKVYNNVFQNMQWHFVFPGGFVGGKGISHNTSTVEPNTSLNLTPPSPYYASRKNKFYDCTYGVYANNIFELKASYMEFRSQQNISGVYQPGKFGVYATSDRFRAYEVNNNLMYNIENGITFNATYGPVKLNGTTFTNTQYAGPVNINANTIKPVVSGAITSEFVSNAISVQNILSSGSTQTVITGAVINQSSNVINNAYRGIYGTCFNTPPLTTNGNLITLRNDPNNNTQYGVKHVNNTTNTITTNNITGPNTTNTLITAIYNSLNNTAAVTCNTVSTTYQAFEFAGSNLSTAWKGNSMTTHTLGLVLTNTAVIGQQGSGGNPIDNTWNGIWSGTKFHTWCNSSTVTASPLYVQSTGVYYPNNNDGLPQIPSYYLANQIFTTTGAYSCGGGSGSFMSGGEGSEQTAYMKLLEKIAGSEIETKEGFSASNFIEQYQLYRTLENKPILQTTSKTLSDFYANNKTASYGKLLQGELDLANGNYSSASSVLSSISSKNYIETNYASFYNLYVKYYTNTYTNSDNTALLTLANRCPFLEGEVIYQARALYNVINSTVESFKDNCPVEDKTSARLANSKPINSINTWNAYIYPNPASSELFINSSKETEEIKIIITDVNGRIIADYYVKTNNFTGNIKLNMNSGIYFVTLSNNNNDKAIKKLVITR